MLLFLNMQQLIPRSTHFLLNYQIFILNQYSKYQIFKYSKYHKRKAEPNFILLQLKSLDAKHKSAVAEVADHLQTIRALQKNLSDTEEQRGILEKNVKLTHSTLEAVRLADYRTSIINK